MLQNKWGQTPRDLAPREVAIWKRIVAEGPKTLERLAYSDVPFPAPFLKEKVEEERQCALRALAEAEEAVRLLNCWPEREVLAPAP